MAILRFAKAMWGRLGLPAFYFDGAGFIGAGLSVTHLDNELFRCENDKSGESFSLGNDFFVVILLGIGDHSLASGLPVGRADFTVSINVLEGFNKSHVFIGISSDWEIVDG